MSQLGRQDTVHDVVGHFRRNAVHISATDPEHLAYYEAYVAALETAYEHSTDASWSSVAEQWFHDLHGALLICVETYRQRCKDTETSPVPSPASKRSKVTR